MYLFIICYIEQVVLEIVIKLICLYLPPLASQTASCVYIVTKSCLRGVSISLVLSSSVLVVFLHRTGDQPRAMKAILLVHFLLHSALLWKGIFTQADIALCVLLWCGVHSFIDQLPSMYDRYVASSPKYIDMNGYT